MAETMMTLEQYETIRKEMEPRRELEKNLQKMGEELFHIDCWCEERVTQISLDWGEDGHTCYATGVCDLDHETRVLVHSVS